MNFFSLVSFNYLLIAVMSAFIALRLLGSFQRKPSAELYSFFLFYVFFSVAFLFWSLPRLFLHTVEYFDTLYAIGYLLFYISLGYMLYLAFSFLGKEGAAYTGFYFIVIFGVLFFLTSYLWAGSSTLIERSMILSFDSQRYGSLLRFATGLVSSLTMAISAFVFFIRGVQARGNYVVFMRSLWIASGISLMFLSVALGFIINTMLVTTLSMAATVFIISGLLAVVRGVLYKRVE